MTTYFHSARFNAFLSTAVLLLALQANASAQDTPAQDDAAVGAAEALSVQTPRIDDTARLLKITSRSGTFKLRKSWTSLELHLEFYKGGKKLDDKSMSIALQGGGAPRSGEGKFSVQLVDLDYLPLGGGEPNHLRAYAGAEVGARTASYIKDFPKSAFDISQITGTYAFHAEHSTAGEVPLFGLVARTGAVRGRDFTPAEYVAAHPEADVLIAVLKLR